MVVKGGEVEGNIGLKPWTSTPVFYEVDLKFTSKYVFITQCRCSTKGIWSYCFII